MSYGKRVNAIIWNDSRHGAPTVEAQLQDENSLLNFVKGLIKLHRETPALWAEGEFEVLEAGYPFVFTRACGKQKLLIAINPSDYCRELNAKIGKILLSQNALVKGECVQLNAVSFVVAEMEA